MTSPELENLVQTGKLKREPPMDERLVADLIDAARAVLAALSAAAGPV